MGKRRRKHNEQTCFRCRLRALQNELHPDGITDDDGRYELMCMAEISGILLAQLPDDDKRWYVHALMKYHNEARESMAEEERQEAMQTRH